MEKTRAKRAAGVTLLEVCVAAGIILLLFGSIATVLSVMTQGTASAEANLVAQAENERGLLAIVNDLQTTDSVGKDPSGVPYFQVKNRGTGTANSISFRKVEGFTVDASQDMVTANYGTPIQYYIDEENRLVREKDGKKEITAIRVSDIKFSITSAGCVTIDITSFSGTGNRRVEVKNQIQITPRNAQKL